MAPSGTGNWKWTDPVAIAIMGTFIIESGFNALGGYEFMGGAAAGMKARLGAAGGVFVAFLGAWICFEGVKMLRLGGALRRVGIGMVAISCACFLLSQWTAWRVMGAALQDGALKREISSQSVADVRAELAKIGITRPIGAIKADLDVFGHWHQSQQNPKWVSNASLIGHNAYAIAIKAGFEPPSQTFFLMDAKRGRTVTAPIYLD
jgi:hypothetical protein